MAHRVGLLELPVSPDGAVIADPGLAVLGEFFRTILEHYASAAWTSAVPADFSVVKTLSFHDPEEMNFWIGDLPLLSVWRDDDKKTAKLTVEHRESTSQLHVLWVMPPLNQIHSSKTHSFFNAFKKIMEEIAQNGRDPCWIAEGDASEAGRAYGSDVLELAGLDRWDLTASRRVPVEIPIDGTRAQSHTGYMVTFDLVETTYTDPEAFGPGGGPTSIDGELTTSDGQVPLGHFRV